MAANKTISVKATAKGYYIGPREIGDVFDFVCLNGQEPKSSWFVKLGDVVEPKAKPALPKAEKKDDALTGLDLV